MANAWMEHVKKFRAKHPKMPYKEVLQKARASYKPKSASAGSKKSKLLKRKTKKAGDARRINYLRIY